MTAEPVNYLLRQTRDALTELHDLKAHPNEELLWRIGGRLRVIEANLEAEVAS